ncbi:unnamed protein product [Darwinula stevensoni]|nr:unnamed protein product [Darwinula stevensoni]CAG0881458.1 unnamed protein product [Darwinula stevensoni]
MGTQKFRLTRPRVMKTQAEDVTLRFRTSRPDGILLITSSSLDGKKRDTLHIALAARRVQVSLHINGISQEVVAGENLNDNRWHNLKYRRRGRSISLSVDGATPVVVELRGEVLTLEHEVLQLGSPFRQSLSPSVSYNSRIHQPYIGSLQHLIFNGEEILELARDNLLNNVDNTATYGHREQRLQDAVTFKNKHTFVGLAGFESRGLQGDLGIYFQMKTLESSGLLLFSGGRGESKHFLAVELVNGHLQCVFDAGRGLVVIRDNFRRQLNDNRWHSVSIGIGQRKSQGEDGIQHTLMVDSQIFTTSSGNRELKLDLGGIVYLGGIHQRKLLPGAVLSKTGYKGCLASLSLNGEPVNPLKDPVLHNPMLISGCLGDHEQCHPDTCKHGGVCIQEWSSFSCDCDLTSFTGHTCTNESNSYRFGSSGGLITLTYPEEQRWDSRTDILALGLITSKSQALLAYIDSFTSSDRLHLQIVEGRVMLGYSLGKGVRTLGDHEGKVDDGEYHVVRVTRSGPNATLQVDDRPLVAEYPSGPHNEPFDGISRIQVGGRWNELKQQIEEPFQGTVSGFVYNGQRLLDMAAYDDPWIRLHGDVHLLSKLPIKLTHDHMQKSPPSEGPTTDDLILPEGSGCLPEYSGGCISLIPPGTDELVTPVYIAPMPPSTPPPPSHRKQWEDGRRNCDDEDCEYGSGDGIYDPIDQSTFQSLIPELSSQEETTKGSLTPSSSSTTTSTTSTSTTTTTETTSTSQTSRKPSTTLKTTTTKATTTTERRGPTSAKPTPPRLFPERPPTEESTDLPHPIQPDWKRKVEESQRAKNADAKSKSETSESTALIAGIIVAAVTLIVLVIFLIIRFRGRSEGSYKVDERQSYQYSTISGTPGRYRGDRQAGFNGMSTQRPGRCKNSKDVREWYV